MDEDPSVLDAVRMGVGVARRWCLGPAASRASSASRRFGRAGSQRCRVMAGSS